MQSDRDRQDLMNGHKPWTVFRASDHSNDSTPHLLLACTGSVATIKLPNILHVLSIYKVAIRVILTEAAAQFLQGQSTEQPTVESLLSIPNVEAIYRDEDEWKPPWTRGAPILHIELRRWADAMFIVPLSANSLAKLVSGISDSLALSVARAWDTTGVIDAVRPGQASGAGDSGSKKLLVVAPAMNTAMWMHPITAKQIRVLEDDWGIDAGGWVQVLLPIKKDLACGDVGSGAMMEWTEIVKVIETRICLSERASL